MFISFEQTLDSGIKVWIEAEGEDFDISRVNAFVYGNIEIYNDLSDKNQSLIMELVFKQMSEKRLARVNMEKD